VNHAAPLALLLAACSGKTPDTAPAAAHTGAPTDNTAVVETEDTGPPLDTEGVALSAITVTPGAIAHAATLSFTLEAGLAPATARCAADRPDLPYPEVLVGQSPAGVAHNIELTGLLADTAYTCELTAGDAASTATFTTPALPPLVAALSLEVETHDPAAAPAFALFNAFEVANADYPEQAVLIVDRGGEVRWYELLPAGNDGGVAAELRGDRVVIGGCSREPLAPWVVDLAGRRVAEVTGVEGVNHDVEWVGDDAWGVIVDTDRGACWEVWSEADRVSSRCVADDPVLGGLGGPRSNSVERASDGSLVASLALPVGMLGLDADGELAWLAIDRGVATVTGDPVPDKVHDVRRVDGCAAPVCVLAYDNGIAAEQSAAVLFAIDPEAGTLTRERTWTQPDWFEEVWGSVDQTPSGSWLIGIGHHEGANPMSRDTELVEVAPDDAVLWRLRVQPSTIGLYRARWLDGCAVFSHAGYCPTL
jgi:hypothetical protein